MTTNAKLRKEFRITFSFEPSDYGSALEGDTVSNTTNLLHLSQRGNSEDSSEEQGERILAINFQPNRGMIVAASIGEESNHEIEFKDDLPPLNKETRIEVSQLRSEGKYIFRIQVDEREVHRVENKNPREFENASVYVSSPWSPSTIAVIKGLQMETNNGGILTFKSSGNTE